MRNGTTACTHNLKTISLNKTGHTAKKRMIQKEVQDKRSDCCGVYTARVHEQNVVRWRHNLPGALLRSLYVH